MNPWSQCIGRRYKNPDPKPENPEKLVFLPVWTLSGTIEQVSNKSMIFQVPVHIGFFIFFNTLEKFKFDNKKALT